MAKFTVAAWERQAAPRGIPSGTMPPAGRGGPGPFTPLRCHGSCEGSQAVTNPRGTLAFALVHVAGRSSILGLVTAHSRVPRQRSRPTREASLGLGLTSALPGGRAVGLPVARHIVWGRWCQARSRRICRPREPHRRPVRWGSPVRLSRFWGIESAPLERSARTIWVVASRIMWAV